MSQVSNLLFFGEHVLDRAAKLPSESVHCICTSPPYWGLRNYGTEPQPWADGWRGELGLEPTPELYVAHLTLIFRELRRVLRKDSTLWLNLGDTYSGSWGNYGGQNRGSGSQRAITTGSQAVNPAYDGLENWRPPSSFKSQVSRLKSKDLVGIPWLVAFALRTDGWYLRQEIIWHKPNPMPESVTDRCTKSHESIFLFSKSERYFYDHLAIAEPAAYDGRKDEMHKGSEKYKDGCTADGNPNPMAASGHEQWRKDETGLRIRNRRSVWTIPTVPYPAAHYAVFPPEIPRLCILAGTSAHGCCPVCSAPYERLIESVGAHGDAPASHKGSNFDKGKTADHQLGRSSSAIRTTSETVGWQPTCSCFGSPSVHGGTKGGSSSSLTSQVSSLLPATVLDPFAGSGTTLAVAAELGRSYIGIELDAKNLKLCEIRLARTNQTLNMDV